MLTADTNQQLLAGRATTLHRHPHQLTDALRKICQEDEVWAWELDGKRYDTGDKLGYLEAIVDTVLAREDMAPAFKALIEDRLGPRAPLAS